MTARKLALTPRFTGLAARSAATSRVGVANRKTNTEPEIMLRRAMSSSGVRFRLHAKDLPGCPDLVVRGRKIAVFCDGDFWHGRRWWTRKSQLAAGWNASYWVAKIERNRRRDRKVTRDLRASGWLVIRVWEGDVRRDPTRVAARILDTIQTLSERPL